MTERTSQYRILLTGTRDCPEGLVFRYLQKEWAAYMHRPYVQGDRFVVVHGDCPRGADRHARNWCIRTIGPTAHEPHPANWDRDGKKLAGFIRNSLMVELGANKCAAFWNGVSKAGEIGAGTFDCFSKAVRAAIQVDVIPVPVGGKP